MVTCKPDVLNTAYFSDCLATQLWIRALQEPHVNWAVDQTSAQLLGSPSPQTIDIIPLFQLFPHDEDAPTSSLLQWIPNRILDFSKSAVPQQDPMTQSSLGKLYDKVLSGNWWTKKDPDDPSGLKALRAIPLGAYGKEQLQHIQDRIDTLLDEAKANPSLFDPIMNQIMACKHGVQDCLKKPTLEPTREVIKHYTYLLEHAKKQFSIKMDQIGSSHEDCVQWLPLLHTLFSSAVALQSLNIHLQLLRYIGFYQLSSPQAESDSDAASSMLKQATLDGIVDAFNVNQGWEDPLHDYISELLASLQSLRRRIQHRADPDTEQKAGLHQTLSHYEGPFHTLTEALSEGCHHTLSEGLLTLHHFAHADHEKAALILHTLTQKLSCHSVRAILMDDHIHRIFLVTQSDPFRVESFSKTAIQSLRWILEQLKTLMQQDETAELAACIRALSTSLSKRQLTRLLSPMFHALSLMFTSKQNQHLFDILVATLSPDELLHITAALGKAITPIPDDHAEHFEACLETLPKTVDSWLNTPHFYNALANHTRRCFMELSRPMKHELRRALSIPTTGYTSLYDAIVGTPSEGNQIQEALEFALHKALLVFDLFDRSDDIHAALDHWLPPLAGHMLQLLTHHTARESLSTLHHLMQDCCHLLAQSLAIQHPHAPTLLRQLIPYLSYDAELKQTLAYALSKEVQDLSPHIQEQLRETLGKLQPQLSQHEIDVIRYLLTELRQLHPPSTAEPFHAEQFATHLGDSITDQEDLHPLRSVCRFIHTLWMQPQGHPNRLIDRYLKESASPFFEVLPPDMATVLDHIIHMEPDNIPLSSQEAAAAILRQDTDLVLTPEQHALMTLCIHLAQYKHHPDACRHVLHAWIQHVSKLPSLIDILFPFLTEQRLVEPFFNTLHEGIPSRLLWPILQQLLPAPSWYQDGDAAATIEHWLSQWVVAARHALSQSSSPSDCQNDTINAYLKRCHTIVTCSPTEHLSEHPILIQYHAMISALFETHTLQLDHLILLDELPEKQARPFKTWVQTWTDFTSFLRGQVVLDPSSLTLTQIDTLITIFTHYLGFVLALAHQEGSLYLRALTWVILLCTSDASSHDKRKRLVALLKKKSPLVFPAPLSCEDPQTQAVIKALYDTQYHPNALELIEQQFFVESSLEQQHAYLHLMSATPLLMKALILRQAHHPSLGKTTKEQSLLTLLTQCFDAPYEDHLVESLLELSSKRLHDFHHIKDLSLTLLHETRATASYQQTLLHIVRYLQEHQDALLAQKLVTEHHLTSIQNTDTFECHMHLIVLLSSLSDALYKSAPSESALVQEANCALVLAFLYAFLHDDTTLHVPAHVIFRTILPIASRLPFHMHDHFTEPKKHVLHAEQCRPLYRLLQLSQSLANESEQWDLLIPLFRRLELFNLNKRQETLHIMFTLAHFHISLRAQLGIFNALDDKREFLDTLYDHHPDLALHICHKLPDIPYETLPFIRRRCQHHDENNAYAKHELTYILWSLESTQGHGPLLSFLSDCLRIDPSQFSSEAFTLRPEQYIKQKAHTTDVVQTLNAFKTKRYLLTWVDQYQSLPNPQLAKMLQQFLTTIIHSHPEDIDVFFPLLLLHHPRAFFTLLNDQSGRLQALLIDHICQGHACWQRPYHSTLFLLLQHDSFKAALLSALQKGLSARTYHVKHLPIELLTEAVRADLVSLQSIQNTEPLLHVLKQLLLSRQDALIQSAIPDIFGRIIPHLEEALLKKHHTQSDLSVPQVLRLLSFSAAAGSQLEHFFATFINDHPQHTSLLLEQTLPNAIFLSNNPNREAILNRIITHLFTLTKHRDVLTNTLLELIKKSSSDSESSRTLRLPLDTCHIIQTQLLQEDTPLSLPHLLSSLQALATLPYPFPDHHQQLLQEAFIQPEKGKLMIDFAQESPDLFKDILLLPCIPSTLFNGLKMGYEVTLSSLKDITLRHIKHFRKVEAAQFLKTYISDAAFGPEVHQQVALVVDQLMPQLDPLSFPQSEAPATPLPLDKTGNVESSFVKKHILHYVNTPYVLLDEKDPYFNAIMDSLCTLKDEAKPLELAHIVCHELEKPEDDINSASLLTAFNALCMDHRQTKQFIKHLLHRQDAWNSFVTINMIRHWQTNSSMLDQLQSSLSHATHTFINDWLDHLGSSCTDSLGTIPMNSDIVDFLLDFCLFLEHQQRHDVAIHLIHQVEQRIIADFNEDPRPLMQRMLHSHDFSDTILLRLLPAFARCNDFEWTSTFIESTFSHPLFPKLWVAFVSQIDDDVLDARILTMHSDSDIALIEQGVDVLKHQPHHILMLFSTGHFQQLDYFVHLMQSWLHDDIYDPSQSSEHHRHITTLLHVAAQDPQPFFFTVMSHVILSDIYPYTPSLDWLYDALVEMTQVPIAALYTPFDTLSGHSQTLVTAALVDAGFMDSNGYLSTTWTPQLPLDLSAVEQLSTHAKLKQRLMSHIRQFFSHLYTSRQTLLQSLFAQKPTFFVDTKGGLLRYILAMSEHSQAWQRLMDDTISIMAANRHEGPALMDGFLSTSPIKDLHTLLFRANQPDLVKTFTLQRLFNKSLVIQATVDGHAQVTQVLRALIRYMVNHLPEPHPGVINPLVMGIQETLLLIFSQAPTLFKSLLDPYKSIIFDHLCLDVDRLMQGRTRLIHWLNDSTNPTHEKLAQEALSLLDRGYHLLSVIAITRSLSSLIPESVDALFKEIGRRFYGDVPPDFFLQSFQPGFAISVIQKDRLKNLHQHDKLYDALFAQGIIDPYGQIIDHHPDPNFKALFELTIPIGTAYALELQQSKAFFEKECNTFTQALRQLLNAPVQSATLDLNRAALTFKWFRRHHHGLSSDWASMWHRLTTVIQAIYKGDMDTLFSSSHMDIVHHLFAQQNDAALLRYVDTICEMSYEAHAIKDTLVATLHVLRHMHRVLRIQDEHWSDSFIALFYHRNTLMWSLIQTLLTLPHPDDSTHKTIGQHMLFLLEAQLPKGQTELTEDLLYTLASKEKERHDAWHTQLHNILNAPENQELSAADQLFNTLQDMGQLLRQDNPYISSLPSQEST